MIKIITLEREYGSGGAVIAQKLAERLGWKLWDQLLTNEIARSMKCNEAEVQEREERRDPLAYRLLKNFMRAKYDQLLRHIAYREIDAPPHLYHQRKPQDRFSKLMASFESGAIELDRSSETVRRTSRFASS